MSYKDDLREALIRVAGDREGYREQILRQYSAFEARPEGAGDVDSMSEKWAMVTLERILDAVKDGEVHFTFNEHGVRIQSTLFDED